MVNTEKYVIQSIERITAFNLETGACSFIVEDIQEGTMTNEEEIVYAEGKNGIKVAAGDGTKNSSFSATNGLVVDGLLAAQTGSPIETGTYTIPNFMEKLKTTDGTTVVTTYTATGATGKEIAYVYKKNFDGTLGEKYAIAADASATEFAYTPDTKTITLPTDVFAAGDEVVVFYDIEVENAKKIVNADDKYSSTEKVIFDIFAKDSCTGKSYCGKIVYPKGKVEGNFEMSFGTEISTHNLNITAMSGGCGTSASNVLWEMYIYDTADVQ